MNSSLLFVESRYRKVYRQKSSCIYIQFYHHHISMYNMTQNDTKSTFVTKTQDGNELIYLMTHEFLSKQTWKNTRKRTISYNYKSLYLCKQARLKDGNYTSLNISDNNDNRHHTESIAWMYHCWYLEIGWITISQEDLNLFTMQAFLLSGTRLNRQPSKKTFTFNFPCISK